MNEVMAEYLQEGLAGLRLLLKGSHLRPQQLASMVIAVVALPEEAADIVLEGQVNGKA